MRFVLCAVLAAFICAVPIHGASNKATLVLATQSESVLFGLSDLRKAVTECKPAGVRIIVSVGGKGEAAKTLAASRAKLPNKPESFIIARSDKSVVIVGSDEVGTMYGCFELAERLGMDGVKALDLKKPIVQSPYVEFRAVNPFLTLPYGDEKNWWFLSEDFWKGYIDQLARARINWIDLHGTNEIPTAGQGNIYPYFVKSDKFPEVGVSPDVADRNLAMLDKITKTAKSRGIKFAMMTYSANWDGPGLRKNPYEATQENLEEYTRECVRKIVRACPDLAMIGFRIGESGQGAEFFRQAYVRGIAESGRKIALYTRNWQTSKDNVQHVAGAFPGQTFCEIKYNGEHYGPPYLVSGGRMSGWGTYSYSDCLTYPRGYKVIWQVRLCGTHRVFPWGNPDFVARTAGNSRIGGAVGFCVEPINAYYPAYDYLHRDGSNCNWYKWMYQRDWFFYNVWGRMSYNPNVPERVWVSKFKARYGAKVGEPFYRAFMAASQIVPYCYTFHSLGPDHRNHAPELETGGDIASWARIGPFDVQNVQSPAEYARRLVEKNPSARLSPIQAANMLSEFSKETLNGLEQAEKLGGDSKEFRCLSKDLNALSNLSQYYAARLRSASDFALFTFSRDRALAESARKQHQEAISQWNSLASVAEAHYKPFPDTLRMKTLHYTWTEEGKKLAAQLKPLDDIGDAAQMGLGLDALEPKGDETGPSVEVTKTEITPAVHGVKTLTVYAKVEDPAGLKSALLKFKPLPSGGLWRTVQMKQVNNVFTASVPVYPFGLMWGIEALDKDDNGTTWPDFRKDIPYRWIDPWDDPSTQAPRIEKMVEFLSRNPSEAAKYSLMIVGHHGRTFNAATLETKKQVLELVKQGLSLVMDDQDYPVFDLSWLPGEIRATDADSSRITFDGSHPIIEGLPAGIYGKRIVVDAFDGGDAEWQFIGDPKAIAVKKYGDGYIILTQFGMPASMWDNSPATFAENLMKYAAHGVLDKPILILDPGAVGTSASGPIVELIPALNLGFVQCEM